MSITRFHKEVGFEPGAIKEIFNILWSLSSLRYTQHAKMETIKDRYAIIPVIKLSDIKPEDIFEYTKDDGELEQFMVRINPPTGAFSYCYSISVRPETKGNIVTVWANTKYDSHRTLNTRIYERV